MPDRDLTLTRIEDRMYHQTDYDFELRGKQLAGGLRIRYVGFAEPMATIPAQTLVRVSLARWWRLRAQDEERCYLQLSGWFLWLLIVVKRERFDDCGLCINNRYFLCCNIIWQFVGVVKCN